MEWGACFLAQCMTFKTYTHHVFNLSFAKIMHIVPLYSYSNE